MMEIINGTVGTILLILFIIGIFCNIVVRKKYTKMFLTMKNKGRDKNLLIIERDYRHGYLKDRVDRIKVFVEREYYEITLSKIPLYAFEDFTISSVYFIALLGLTFTVILVALPQINLYHNMISVFFLSIEGLFFGTILMVLRTFLGINALRDIFKVNLCNYLENELELFDEAERDDEGNLFNKKTSKISKKNENSGSGDSQGLELSGHGVFHLSDYRQSKTESIEFDEMALIQVLDEILG